MSAKEHARVDEDPNGEDTGEVIEGGDITGVDHAGYRVDPLKRHRAATARKLAYLLVTSLALSVVLHYVVTAVLLFNERPQIVESLNGIYSTWLPVISGLAGSAVTYFFTREE